jgi:hypothetical protein
MGSSDEKRTPLLRVTPVVSCKLRQRLINKPGFDRVAVKRLDEALHPIVKVVFTELGAEPNSEKDRGTGFVDPVDKMLDVEAVLDECCGPGACVAGVEIQNVGLHSLQHGLASMMMKTPPL